MRSAAIAGIGLAVATAFPAAALTVGDTSGSSNCWPFGCYDEPGYQIVYNADNFSEPMSIGSITFYLGEGSRHSEATFTLGWYISATDYLDSSSVYADNLGTQLADWGATTLGGSAAGATLEFSGPSFTYDPADGDLLLNVEITDFVASGNAYLRSTADTSDLYRVAGSGYVNSASALTTTFSAEASAVPAPAAGLLLAGGLGALGLMRRRRAA